MPNHETGAVDLLLPRRRITAEKVALRQRIEFPRDGDRRITHHLRAEGTLVNHKAVARLMQQHNLQVRPLRKFVRTTDSNHDGPIFPKLVRDVSPTGPNQVWVGDITYIRIACGFCLSNRDARGLVPPRD